MSLPPSGTAARFTAADRETITRARELAGLRSTAAVHERFPGWSDPAPAYAEAFATARWLLDEVAAIAERLAADTTPEAAK